MACYRETFTFIHIHVQVPEFLFYSYTTGIYRVELNEQISTL